jgi:hypothetical protein
MYHTVLTKQSIKEKAPARFESPEDPCCQIFKLKAQMLNKGNEFYLILMYVVHESSCATADSGLWKLDLFIWKVPEWSKC